MRRWFLGASAGLVSVVILIGAAAALLSDTELTAARFATLHQDHTALRAFLRRMPKGGDLHVHLSGAVYAERLIAWAKDEKLCLRGADVIAGPPCDADDTVPIADIVAHQSSYDRLIGALSMRWFQPSSAMPSGHDQFFAAFGRFSRATWNHFAEMVADQLDHYAAEQVQYAEFMTTFIDGGDRDTLAAAIGGETDRPAMLATLKRNDLDGIVAKSKTWLDAQTADIDKLLACKSEKPRPGCKVTYRFIAQVNRNHELASIFVETAAAAALVRIDPRVVGFNFVAPEDYLIALRDYREQMQTIRFLAGDDVPVALHAGELWLGLVPPEALTFHIRDAAVVAGARRIGHGVALAFETDMNGLLAEMRRKDVAVEINLTSNDVILGVRGKDHPLPTYLAAGVPVVLSTDDAGVSRIDLTNEYFRAARDYRLGYRTLKAIARNALIHSFLSPADKQQALKRFDDASAEFERSLADGQTVLDRLVAVVGAVTGGL